MDLEYESDGLFELLYCLSYFLRSENISAPAAHRHDIGYVTSHKGPILCATFSHDGMCVTINNYRM